MNAARLLLAGIVAAALALPAQAQRFGRPARPAPRPAAPPSSPSAVRAPTPPPATSRPGSAPAPQALSYPTVRDVAPAAVVRGLPGETPLRPDHPAGLEWWRAYPYAYRPPYYRPSYYPPALYSSYSPYPHSMAYLPGTTVSTPAPPPAPDPEAGARRTPTASGPLTVAPPGAAIIRVVVADNRAQVAFDGVETATTGTLRTFVTPPFQSAEAQTFYVTARFVRNGRPVTEQRQVSVTLGQVQTVNFNQPAGW